jgi:hypothetical protein
MIDENAFGILISNTQLEDEEYASDELEVFVDWFSLFRRLVLQYLAEHPPGVGAHALDLGHALYVEVPEDSAAGLLNWVKALRAALTASDFASSVILSHGGRWVPKEQTEPSLAVEQIGSVPLVSMPGPSEPLRRALFAETATHGLAEEAEAWGAGFYLDTEAADALNIRPKNAPTVLNVAGATFFRVSR